MPLKNLREISFTNNLENAVSNVSILYCESNKSINNIFNRETVNVETSNGILWSRLVFFQDEDVKPSVIQPSSTCKTSAEHVCFGENDGFWQLYFTYKGDDYKLERNDYELTLTPDCNQQDLKIDLYFSLKGENKLDIKADFQIATIKAKFNVVRGQQATRMVHVRVQNGLKEDISCVNAIFSEGNTTLKETQPYLSRIVFGKVIIKSKDTLRSSNSLSYNCFGQFEHRLRFNFICREQCYEIECGDQKFGCPIKLTESDYENVLDINICQGPINSTIDIKVITQKETKSFPMIAENISKRKSRIDRQVLKIREISLDICLKGLIEALIMLTKDSFRENSPNKGSKEVSKDDQKVFYPCLRQKLSFEEDKLEGCKLKIPCQMQSIKPLMKNIIISLEALKKQCNNFNESLDCLIELVEPLEKLNEISEIVESIALVRSMNTIDILCKILIPSGWDEKGLTFYTSKSETAKEISVDVRRLIKAINEELDLWDMSAFSRAEAKPLKTKEIQKNKLKIYQKQYSRLFELFTLVREELIEGLLNTASELHFKELVFNITTLSNSSVGIIGSGLAIAGLVLAPFTAGASLPMAAVGAGVGVTTGVVGIGTTITEGFLVKNSLEPIVSLAVNDNYVFNVLTELVERQRLLLESFSTFAEADDYTKNLILKYNLTYGLSSFGFGAVRTGVHAAKTTLVKFGSVALALVFDITTLVFKSIKLSKGGCSVLGYKLESDALLLRLELEERKKIEDDRKKERTNKKSKVKKLVEKIL